MIWDHWPRIDNRGLARYVTAVAAANVDLGLDRLTIERAPNGRLTIAHALYDRLVQKQIRYTLEGYDPSAALQSIRTPVDVFQQREGTCLDLALLFCGACLRFELLPFIVVLDGHALAAVSITHGLRDWNSATRPGRALFDEGPLTDRAELLSLIDVRRALVAVECTGFAGSAVLNAGARAWPETVGREQGTMSFERAVMAGREQLDGARALLYVIDVAVARYAWRIEALPVAGVEAPSEIPGLMFQAWCPSGLRPSGRDAADDPVPAHLQQRIDEAGNAIDTLEAIAAEFAERRRWAAALKAYRAVSRLALGAADPGRHAAALERMGGIYWKIGDKARACDRWRTCWNARREDELPAFESRLRRVIDG